MESDQGDLRFDIPLSHNLESCKVSFYSNKGDIKISKDQLLEVLEFVIFVADENNDQFKIKKSRLYELVEELKESDQS